MATAAFTLSSASPSRKDGTSKRDDAALSRPTVPSALNKAFMLCCAAPRAPGSRDWNEDFQRAFDAPAFDQFTARDREGSLRRILKDFTEACASRCKSIVEERMTPSASTKGTSATLAAVAVVPEQLYSTPVGAMSSSSASAPMEMSALQLPATARQSSLSGPCPQNPVAAPPPRGTSQTLPPPQQQQQQQQGELSGHPNSFLYGQLFIRLWPHERQARRFMHTARLVMASPPAGVNMPLCCLVSYCGMYFTGHALLPLDATPPIVYRGDGEPDPTPINEIAHIAVRHCLDIANCIVEPVEGQQKLAGIELTAGTDGRIYFTNTMGLLPLTSPEIENSTLRRYESVIIVDVPGTAASDRKHATEMGTVFFFRAAPSIIEIADEEARQRQLVVVMRKFGLSVTSLGHLGTLVSDEDSLNMEQRACTLNMLCVEMLARTLKTLVYSELTALFMSRRIDDLEPVVARALLHFVTADDRAAKKALIPTISRKFLGGRHVSSASPLFQALMLARSSKRKLILTRACELAGFTVDWSANGGVDGTRVKASVVTERVALLSRSNAFGTEDELKAIVCPPRLFSFGLPRVIAMQQARGDVREALANANLVLADRKQRHGRDSLQYAIAAMITATNQIMADRVDTGVSLYQDALANLYKSVSQTKCVGEAATMLIIAKWSATLAQALLSRGRRAVAVLHAGKSWQLVSRVLDQLGPASAESLFKFIETGLRCIDDSTLEDSDRADNDDLFSSSGSLSPPVGLSKQLIMTLSPTLSSSGCDEQLAADTPVPLPPWIPEALAAMQRQFGPHGKSIPLLEAVMHALLNSDRDAECLPILKCLIEATRAVHGADSDRLLPLLETYASVGSSVDFASNFVKSHVSLLDSVRIARIHACGQPDMRLAVALNNLGSLHALGRMYRVAYTSIEEARRIFDALALPEHDPHRQTCNRNFALCRSRRRNAAALWIQSWYVKWRRRRRRKQLREGGGVGAQVPEQQMQLDDAEMCESLLSSVRARSVMEETQHASAPAAILGASQVGSSNSTRQLQELSPLSASQRQPVSPAAALLPQAAQAMPPPTWVSMPLTREAVAASQSTNTTPVAAPPTAAPTPSPTAVNNTSAAAAATTTVAPATTSAKTAAGKPHAEAVEGPVTTNTAAAAPSGVSIKAAEDSNAKAKAPPPDVDPSPDQLKPTAAACPSAGKGDPSSPKPSSNAARPIVRIVEAVPTATKAQSEPSPTPERSTGSTTASSSPVATSGRSEPPSHPPSKQEQAVSTSAKAATAPSEAPPPSSSTAVAFAPSPPKAARSIDAAPRVHATPTNNTTASAASVGFMRPADAAAILQRLGRGYRGRRVVIWAKPPPPPAPPAPRVLSPIVLTCLRALASCRRRESLRRVAAAKLLVRLARGFTARKDVADLVLQRRLNSFRAASARVAAAETDARNKLLTDERNASKDIFDQLMTMRRLQRDERQRRLERDERLRRNKQKREELEEDEMGLRHAIGNQATFEAAQLQRALREKLRALQQGNKKVEEPAVPAPDVALKRLESRRKTQSRTDLTTTTSSESGSGVKPHVPPSAPPPPPVPRYEGYVRDDAIDALLEMESQLRLLRLACTSRLAAQTEQHEVVKQLRIEAQEALDGQKDAQPPTTSQPSFARKLSGLRGSTPLIPSSSVTSARLTESTSINESNSLPRLPSAIVSSNSMSGSRTARGPSSKPPLAAAVSVITAGSYLARSQRSAATQARRD